MCINLYDVYYWITYSPSQSLRVVWRCAVLVLNVANKRLIIWQYFLPFCFAIAWYFLFCNYSPSSDVSTLEHPFMIFSAANLALAGFPLTNALGENLPSLYFNMFNLLLWNAATIRHSLLKFGHMHLYGKGHKYFSPHCCRCNSFGCIAAIRCGNACPGLHSDNVYSGSEHRQFNSPRLVKREAGFPNPQRALIGSNQLWRVNDSPYYRELGWTCYHGIYQIYILEYDILQW